MEYIPPLNGDTEDPDRSYVNAVPGVTEGSRPDARALEHPLRELLAAITAAGVVPNVGDLTQLKQALYARHVLHAEAFTASGTFIVPAGVTRIWVSATAAGGGGGGGHTSSYYGGGASSGQSIIRKGFDVVPGTEIDIVIGGSGPGGAVGLAGTSGGDTVIGDLITLLGGDGGNPGTASGNGTGGGGSEALGSNAGSDATTGLAGRGGDSLLGFGGATRNGNGTSGALGGGGAGGRFNFTGGNGGEGFALVEY